MCHDTDFLGVRLIFCLKVAIIDAVRYEGGHWGKYHNYKLSKLHRVFMLIVGKLTFVRLVFSQNITTMS